MEPFTIVTINNKYVAAPPSQTNSCMASALTVVVLPHDYQMCTRPSHHTMAHFWKCPWAKTTTCGTTCLCYLPFVGTKKCVACGHSNSRWWSQTTARKATSPIPTYTTCATHKPWPIARKLKQTRGQKCYGTPTFSAVPNKGDKIRSGCHIPTFWGAQKRTEVLRNRYILGETQKGEKIKSGCLTPTFSGAHKKAEVPHNPCILRDPQRRGQHRKWLPHRGLVKGPREGGSAVLPLHSRGVPKQGDKIKNGYLRRAFSGPHKRRKCYVSPAFSGVPNKGGKIRSGCLTPAFSGAHRRTEVLRYTCILGGSPRQNQKWLPHACLLGGPQEGISATLPLHSRGSPNKGDEMRNGCLSPIFAGAHKRAEVLRNPSIPGGPQQRGQNGKWLPHPYHLKGPQEGGSATLPLHSQGSPNKGDKMRNGCLSPIFAGAHKRAEVLRNPRILGGPLTRE